MSRFAVVKKTPSHRKKIILKNNPFNLFLWIRSSKRCTEVF